MKNMSSPWNSPHPGSAIRPCIAIFFLLCALLLMLDSSARAQAPASEPPLAATSAEAGSADVPPSPPVIGASAPISVNTLPDALSPVGMFLNADIIVKAVMIGLALASVLTWTVWLFKTIELGVAKRSGRAGLRSLRAARTLSDAAAMLGGGRDVVAQLVAAAEDEVELSAGGSEEGIKERLTWQLERVEAAASRRIAFGMGLLATVGAVAPFVGLFGTVWGIMNSFIGISRVHTTNLAVVAPGIAEALLATAIGLVAAIPAVVIYNAFSRAITGYRATLRDASVAILRLVSRDLDRPAKSISRTLDVADAPLVSEAAE